MTFMTLTIGIVQVLLKPILLPHVGTTTMGQVETAAATGILAGAGLVTVLARLRPTTLLSLGTAGAGITMMLLALRTWPWWAGSHRVRRLRLPGPVQRRRRDPWCA